LKIRKFPVALKGFETAKRRRGGSVEYEYNCKTKEETNYFLIMRKREEWTEQRSKIT
jgi:hypothetical protein